MHLFSKYIRLIIILAALFVASVQGYGYNVGNSTRSYLDTIRTKIENLSGLQRVGQDLSGRDSSKLLQDTLLAPADSIGTVQDTVAKDSAANKSSIEEPIFSGGRDSIVKDFDVDGRKMIYYYGDVKVTYGDLELSSEYMAFDVDSKTVFAKGLPDTSGQIIGKPVMKQGEQQYEMESVYYNFNTEKAKIKNMITQEAEGYLHGKYIKKMPDNSINIAKGKYTTCDHEHPHFYLQMTTAKVITDGHGGQKTVFGPSYVVLEDVPTPFALPFGFVPQFGGSRASGLLMPTYGEEAARGFF
ncbi:MAG: hypothetical protein II202_00375, partial [Bacteroidales bacterium]|nr:hypothetical protein [Bacteroidales bacterium]